MSDILSNLEIAAPCSADWQNMAGNDQVRFCDSCKLNVYNISEMTKNEAEQLITNTEGRGCVRLYKRKDGTIITENCPVGLRLLKRKIKWLAAGVAAVLSAVGINAWFTKDCLQGSVVSRDQPKLPPPQFDVAAGNRAPKGDAKVKSGNSETEKSRKASKIKHPFNQ